MKKALTLSTICALLLMASVAAFNVEVGFSLFMSTDVDHIIARIVIAYALAATLIATRPRSQNVRLVLAGFALLIIAFSITQTINYQLGLLDSVAYFLAGLLVSMEAFEAEFEASAGSTLTKTHRV